MQRESKKPTLYTELFNRHPNNPILTAQDWPYPANTVFNAGACQFGDETLLLVRVEDRRGHSHLTVARSKDGVSIYAQLIPNAAWRLVWALSTLKAPDERVLIEGFYDDLLPATAEELGYLANAPWSDDIMLEQVRNYALPAMQKHGPVVASIVDDTGFPKKGTHSVGVVRQYCGQVGKQENCRVAVSLSISTRRASLPIAWRLYLPHEWADDPARRKQAGVPQKVTFTCPGAPATIQGPITLFASEPFEMRTGVVQVAPWSVEVVRNAACESE